MDEDGNGKYEYVMPEPIPIAKIKFAINFMNESGFNDFEIEYCSNRMYFFHYLNFTFKIPIT